MSKQIMNLGRLKLIFLVISFCNQLLASPIEMNYANFKLLDKISNELIEKTIPVNGFGMIGTLNIKVYSCLKEPPDEIPEDYVLIDVQDTFFEDQKSIFRGWMISSSPDIVSLEHAIYDLMLLGCINDKTS